MRNCRYLDRQRFDSVDADIDRANAEHFSDSDSESEDDVRGFSHPIGPNMADGSETSSDEPDSDDDSVSSSDSDTPIIAVSRRDPSIRVIVRRLPRANDSDNERDRLHAEYLSAD